jgi:hypothetical protein
MSDDKDISGVGRDSTKIVDDDIVADWLSTRTDDLMPTETSTVASEPMIVLSPRLVAIVALVFGLACLATLAFVAAIRHADALSTVALALAIVAFAVQLLASAAQNQSSTQQSLRSEQLNTQTRSLLAEMQTTARGTETMVREQFGQLLHAFMDAAKAAERGNEFDQAEFDRRLMQNMQQQAALSAPESSERQRSVLANVRRRQSEERRARAARAAGPFPSRDEAEQVLPDLVALPEGARDRLAAYRGDKLEVAESPDRPGWFEGFPQSGPGANPIDDLLREKGFLRLTRLTGENAPTNGGVVYQLTEKGDLASRIMTASGDVPDWAEPLFKSSLG